MITVASRSWRCATWRVRRPGPIRCSLAVRAAGINIGEAKIREGLVREIFPATFPSGEGSDLAGVIEEIGAGVRGVAVGDEVIGFTNDRASHAEYVLVEAANLTSKPAEVPWEVAGALFRRRRDGGRHRARRRPDRG
jgi:NADPH:quinone reductase-like Zn-dependent oxidoreductase